MITERKAANAVGGKTARACDGCLRKRARWFCAADDAFLCQACDASVHLANQLASRHERIRLETASCKGGGANSVVNTGGNYSAPAWHQGFTRKARTPRHNNKPILGQQRVKGKDKILNLLPLVPQINGNGSDEEGNMAPHENEDLLLHRVPVFHPFASELCDILTSQGAQLAMGDEEGNIAADGYEGKLEGTCDLDDLPGFLPSDVDLAEFAADVESLLGQGLDDDDDCPGTNDLGLLDCKEEEDGKFVLEEKTEMKVKDEEEVEAIAALSCFDQAFDMPRESFHWNFDYDFPLTGDDKEEEKVRVPVVQAETIMNSGCKKEMMKSNISLRLNYEAVITAWASQGSPWTSGSRPRLNLNECWPDCKGDNCAEDVHQTCGGLGGRAGGGDGEREARVLRYKEKRRKRLFSKKIRYEVRKLNAEKRPRMKGRFVKRTSFLGTAVNNCQPPCLHF